MSALLVLLCLGVLLTPAVRRRGWSEFVPPRILMLGLPAFDAEADAAASSAGAALYVRIASGATRWERLLIAHGLARRLGNIGPSTPRDVADVSYLLPKLGTEAEPLLPALMKLLHADEESIRYEAALALQLAPVRHERIARALVPLLTDTGESVAVGAAWTIGRLCVEGALDPTEFEAPIQSARLDDAFVVGAGSGPAPSDPQVIERMLSHGWSAWRRVGSRFADRLKERADEPGS